MDATERLEVIYTRTLKEGDFPKTKGYEIHFKRWVDTEPDLRLLGLSNITVGPFTHRGSDLLVRITFDYKAGRRPLLPTFPPWKVGRAAKASDLSRWFGRKPTRPPKHRSS